MLRFLAERWGKILTMKGNIGAGILTELGLSHHVALWFWANHISLLYPFASTPKEVTVIPANEFRGAVGFR